MFSTFGHIARIIRDAVFSYTADADLTKYYEKDKEESRFTFMERLAARFCRIIDPENHDANISRHTFQVFFYQTGFGLIRCYRAGNYLL